MDHVYFSSRHSKGKTVKKLDLSGLKRVFLKKFSKFKTEGYFDSAFGSYCVDAGEILGNIEDIEYEILLRIKKEDLWPIPDKIENYSEDDLFDIIEFLYQHITMPLEGDYHSWNDCGMHWHTFDQAKGRAEFVEKINEMLSLYERSFELSPMGEILQNADQGFEPIFDAPVPTSDKKISDKVDTAIRRYRRHGASLIDRRDAVRDLADVLEYLRPRIGPVLDSKDESDLFNIANNFGIRHHNSKQKTNYDENIWSSWMFYYYLATIHALLRLVSKNDVKIE